MMSRWPQGRRIGTDRSREAALGQVLDVKKFGTHCKADEFAHPADADAEWLGGARRGASGPWSRDESRYPAPHNGRAVSVFPEKAVKGAKQRPEIGRDGEKMLMDIR
jgi:hypothetical protein